MSLFSCLWTWKEKSNFLITYVYMHAHLDVLYWRSVTPLSCSIIVYIGLITYKHNSVFQSLNISLHYMSSLSCKIMNIMLPCMCRFWLHVHLLVIDVPFNATFYMYNKTVNWPSIFSSHEVIFTRIYHQRDATISKNNM